jgi:hypothetical protein
MAPVAFGRSSVVAIGGLGIAVEDLLQGCSRAVADAFGSAGRVAAPALLELAFSASRGCPVVSGPVRIRMKTG